MLLKLTHKYNLILKVQCISSECGFYHELKLGQWYVVEEERIIEGTKTSYWGTFLQKKSLSSFGQERCK